jgi:hypothetical protein
VLKQVAIDKPMTILHEVNQGRGWALLSPLSDDSLASVHSAIYNSFSDIIDSANLNSCGFNDFSDLCYYHKSSIAINFHEDLWSKRNRLLNEKSSRELNLIFHNHLSGVFRDFAISDEEDLGYPNIYWRLVRPNSATDVGPAHRDSWFWSIATHQKMPLGKDIRYKVWIPLIISEGLNSLSFWSYSQLDQNIRWATIRRNDCIKPCLIDDDINSKLSVTSCHAGQPILFHDDVIHKGPVNKTDQTRVSLEFTLCVNEHDLA